MESGVSFSGEMTGKTSDGHQNVATMVLTTVVLTKAVPQVKFVLTPSFVLLFPGGLKLYAL